MPEPNDRAGTCTVASIRGPVVRSPVYAQLLATVCTKPVSSVVMNTPKEIIADDCVFEEDDHTTDGLRLVGKGTIINFIRDLMSERNDLKIEVEEIIGAGHQCVLKRKMARHYRGEGVFAGN